VRIFVVINPAAGGSVPILKTLNQVFQEHDIDWEVGITHGPGDAQSLAREAAQQGYDIVAGYGGDGTQMEVVNGLLNSDALFGILPGGTGNAMAFELGIPRELPQAVELLCTSDNRRSVDVARCEERNFLLRAYTGPGPEHVASREEKDRLGILAYPLATLRVLRNLQPTEYHITVDGESFTEPGLACFVFNAGSSGGIPANIPSVNISDGMLDLFLLSPEAQSPLALATHLLEGESENSHLHGRKGREITVDCEDPQTVWLDGESAGTTPVRFSVSSGAITVVVPD